MKKTPIVPVFLSWLLVMILGAYAYHKYCSHSAIQDAVTDAEIAQSLEPAAIDHSQPNEMLRTLTVFGDSLKLSESFHGELVSAISQMQNNPKVNYLITSFVSKEEANQGFFPDQGLLKANHLKNRIISKGVDSRQLGISSQFTEKEALLNKGFLMEAVAEIDRAGVEDYKILFEYNPLVVHFDEENNMSQLTLDHRIDFLDLVTYMDLDPDLLIVIEGHSHESESKKEDVLRSKACAEFFENYLINNGIHADRIITKAFGSDKPIGNNSTEQGKMKNRRVEISVVK